MQNTEKPFGIVIHGGAGGILRKNYTVDEEKQHLGALESALNIGYDVLSQGGSSVDSCIAAILSLEDCPLYNAGKGAVYNAEGTHELDASIMDGRTKSCGGVGIIRTVKNPILLARAVMDKTPHSLLAAEGAENFAASLGLNIVENHYFNTDKRLHQYLAAKKQNIITMDHIDDDSIGSKGTVGAVSLDQFGNIAAATSTGGMTNKKTGRIGDTAIIGAGTYADNNTAALSCTGSGDIFLALNTSKTVSDLMEYKNMTLEQAAQHALAQVKECGGDGGIIGITKSGDIIEAYNSAGMFRAHRLSSGPTSVLMYGDHI